MINDSRATKSLQFFNTTRKRGASQAYDRNVLPAPAMQVSTHTHQGFQTPLRVKNDPTGTFQLLIKVSGELPRSKARPKA